MRLHRQCCSLALVSLRSFLLCALARRSTSNSRLHWRLLGTTSIVTSANSSKTLGGFGLYKASAALSSRGEFAHCFFTGNTSEVTRLDIVVRQPQALEDYLKQESYTPLPPSPLCFEFRPKGFQHSSGQFFVFLNHPDHLTLRPRNGELSTPNILSWNKAYSLVPYKSFIENRTQDLASATSVAFCPGSGSPLQDDPSSSRW